MRPWADGPGLAETMAEIACERLVQPQRERDFEPLIRRTVMHAEEAARRLSLKRYAPSDRADGVQVVVREPGGAERLVYDGAPLVDGMPVKTTRA